MSTNIKLEDDTMKALRIRKAQFDDKTYDITIRNMLGITKHVPTTLNPTPTPLSEMNIRNNK